MRPIDAELLTTNIAQIAKNCARSDAQKALIGRILYMIENMPTIETEPVKHGRWINLTPMGQRAKQRMTWHGCVAWMCSECHGGARFFSEDLPYELCPHCGAIMTFGGDGEEQCAHTEYMERVAKELASEDGGSDD